MYIPVLTIRSLPLEEFLESLPLEMFLKSLPLEGEGILLLTEKGTAEGGPDEVSRVR